MKLAFLLFTFFLSAKIFSQSVEKVINVPISHESGLTRHALLYTPDDYGSGSAKYPLMIFLHGPSEAGTDISLIYNNPDAGGPAYFIEHGTWPSSFINPNTGKAYKFIIVSPQSDNSWNSSGDETGYMVKYLVANYRVDTNRIYITGLSAGGGSAIEYAAHLSENEDNLDSARTYDAAAIVTMSAATIDPLPSWASKIVANKIPAWGFGDPDNDIYGQNTRFLINQMNNVSAGSGIFTPDKYGHSGWGHFYTPDFKQTINGKSMNIYQWMLTNTRNPADTVVAAPAAPPTVSAGKNKSITLPTSTTTLSGHGQAAPGDTITYAWTNLSGPPAAVITTPTTPSTKIKGLAEGSYVFKLTVTQNDGQTAFDTVSIAVDAAPPDTTKAAPPQATLPPASKDTTTIPIAPTPPPPSDTTKIPVTPTPPPPADTTTALAPSIPPPASSDTTVLPATPIVTPPAPPPPPPIPPVANAGPDQFITLPANSITLNAGASTGTLSSYSWTELSGGAATIIKPSAASTTVIGLTGGIHIFQLSVNGGASTGRVTVTVQAPIPFSIPGTGNTTSSISTGTIPPADSTAKAPDEGLIKSNLLLHPNPATDNAFLEISNSLTGPMLVQIIDAEGVLRATYSFQKELDHIQVTLPVTNLAHGLYFVHIRIGNWSRTIKLMKL